VQSSGAGLLKDSQLYGEYQAANRRSVILVILVVTLMLTLVILLTMVTMVMLPLPAG
jgi:hypothetical protein